MADSPDWENIVRNDMTDPQTPLSQFSPIDQAWFENSESGLQLPPTGATHHSLEGWLSSPPIDPVLPSPTDLDIHMSPDHLHNM